MRTKTFTNIMMYRKILYFQWNPSRVHQVMYTAGAVDIYHVIQMKKNITRLPVLALIF